MSADLKSGPNLGGQTDKGVTPGLGEIILLILGQDGREDGDDVLDLIEIDDSKGPLLSTFDPAAENRRFRTPSAARSISS